MRCTVLSSGVLVLCGLVLAQVMAAASLMDNCCVGVADTDHNSWSMEHDTDDGKCAFEVGDWVITPNYWQMALCPYKDTSTPCPLCQDPTTYRPCGKYQLHCYKELHKQCGLVIHSGSADYCHGCCAPKPQHD